MVIEIPDRSELLKLALEGSVFTVSSGAEAALIQLKEAEEGVENALTLLKEEIKRAMIELDPLCTSVKGDRVSVSLSSYGAKYGYDSSLADSIPQGMLTLKETITVNADAVDKWAKEHGGLPEGITVPSRDKSISIRIK